MSELVLKLAGYRITGEVYVRLWSGEEGLLDMEPSIVPKEEVPDDVDWKEYVRPFINDGKYGAADILSATVSVMKIFTETGELYQNQLHHHASTVMVQGPFPEAKRGI